LYKFSDCTLDEKAMELLHQKYSTDKFYKRFMSESEEASCKTINKVLRCVILKQYLLLAVSQEIVIIHYVKDKNDKDAEELKDFIRPYLINNDKNDMPERLFMVINEKSYFELRSIKLKQTDADIAAFYNDDFMPVHQIINESLQEEGSGLIILHGLHGTGKTSYIRHLIKTTTRRFIYIPSDLVEVLARPSFLPFLSDFPGSVLILEDCEELLKQRQIEGEINPSIVTILNMTDGLLGDGLQLKFICTFNASLKNIDKALLRKSRLIAKYNFRKLETEKVNKLIALQNLTIPYVDNPMSLSEIFNYKDRDFEQETSNRIGFN
jgi:hypothetical protein